MKYKVTGVSLFPTTEPCVLYVFDSVVEQLPGCTLEDTLTVHYRACRQGEVVRTLLCVLTPLMYSPRLLRKLSALPCCYVTTLP